MVHSGPGRLRLRHRDLRRDSGNLAGFRSGSMVDSDLERFRLRPVERRDVVHCVRRCAGSGYSYIAFRCNLDEEPDLHLECGVFLDLVPALGQRCGQQCKDPAMVHSSAGRVRLRRRHLLCDSFGDVGLRCRAMVDPNLEQRRLWPLEHRHELHRALTEHSNAKNLDADTCAELDSIRMLGGKDCATTFSRTKGSWPLDDHGSKSKRK